MIIIISIGVIERVPSGDTTQWGIAGISNSTTTIVIANGIAGVSRCVVICQYEFYLLSHSPVLALIGLHWSSNI